jgi:hypothetical protein
MPWARLQLEQNEPVIAPIGSVHPGDQRRLIRSEQTLGVCEFGTWQLRRYAARKAWTSRRALPMQQGDRRA